MQLVAILGSPHGRHGNTGLLLDGVVQGARTAGAAVELFTLTECDVKACRSCECCHSKGYCPIPDDFDTLKAAITAADGLILASPNYIMSVSAQLKAVLDRCAGPIHTQEWRGKYAAAVVTSGSGGSEEVEAYLLRALRMSGFSTVGSVGALGWQMANPETRPSHLAAAMAVGATLVDAIRTRRHYPDQAAEREVIMNRMHDLVRMQKDRWVHEYEFWQACPK
jgi:multimeric flavodoxin WrbA